MVVEFSILVSLLWDINLKYNSLLSDKASRRNDKKASINDAIIPVQVSDTISRALDDEDASLMSDIEDLSVNIIDVPENIASASINISKTRNIERELFKEILDEVKKKAEDIEDIQAAVRQKIQSKSFNDIVDLKTINDDTLENDIEIEDLGLRYNDDTFENLTAVILQHTDKVNELGTGMFNASTPTTMLKNISVTEMKEYFPTENQKDNCIVYSCLIKKAYEQVDKFLFS